MIKKHITVRALAVLVLSFTATLANANSFPELADLIEENSPSVVKIEVEVVHKQQQMQLPPGAPDIFKRFFEHRQPRGDRKGQSMGSGFVISDDGYILTNHHVVDSATKITVRFPDHTEFDAEVIGSDASSDLALLKVDADDLKPVKFAKKAPRVGDWVVAIGSPFGLDYSASAGIVSAKGRSLPTEKGTDYVPFIQTDVAINPGNSGGPLFNLEGEVVGINSQIYTRSGGYMGLSFAIPTEVAEQVVAQLKESGEVVRGWLGVAIQPVDRELAEANGLDRTKGALISNIEEDSPADKSGLEVGDIVLEFNGKEIVTPGDLTHVIGLLSAGKTYDVLVMRELDETELEVTLGERPNDDRGRVVGEDASAGRLGLVVTALSDEQLEKVGIKGGVIVKSVDDESPAMKAGLRSGDIITSVNFTDVESIAQFAELQDVLPANKRMNIRFVRQGRLVFTTIKIIED